MIQDNTEDESGDTHEKDSTMDENRLTH